MTAKTWLITGAGHGMGVEFAKAALTAGHNVVVTGRSPGAVTKAVGETDDLLVVKLDVTSRQDVEAAVKTAVERFGGIDVLVNNAANFESAPLRIERQLAVSLIGRMNVTRAVLPVMRKQRSGHVVTISSLAGLAGFCLQHRLPRVEVRRRRLDGVAGPRGRAVRDPRSSTPGSSAPSCSPRSRRTTRRHRSRTTPSATPPCASSMRAWMVSSPATCPSSPRRC